MTPSTHKSIFQRVQRALASFMAVEDDEWDLVRRDPRLREEILFQSFATLICATFFTWCTYHVASDLLEYPLLGALGFAIAAGVCLAGIDRHLLIQMRGAANAWRSMIWKVRLGSMTIVTIAGFLTAVTSFRADVDAVLLKEAATHRATLESEPRYATSLASARQALADASAAETRADELRRSISELAASRATALAEEDNELQGNTTGAHVRIKGYGVRARGFAVEAARLAAQQAAARQELEALGDPTARVAAARAELGRLTGAIDAEVAQSTAGASQRIAALVRLVKTNAAAALACIFFLAASLGPDIGMLIAMSRSSNEGIFATLRDVQDRRFAARCAEWRASIRQRESDAMAPLDVKLITEAASQRTPESPPPSDAVGAMTDANDEERAA